jgi:hypothetical protein
MPLIPLKQITPFTTKNLIYSKRTLLRMSLIFSHFIFFLIYIHLYSSYFKFTHKWNTCQRTKTFNVDINVRHPKNRAIETSLQTIHQDAISIQHESITTRLYQIGNHQHGSDVLRSRSKAAQFELKLHSNHVS